MNASSSRLSICHLNLQDCPGGLWLWRCGTIDSDAGPAGDLCQLCMCETKQIIFLLIILYCYVLGLANFPQGT